MRISHDIRGMANQGVKIEEKMKKKDQRYDGKFGLYCFKVYLPIPLRYSHDFFFHFRDWSDNLDFFLTISEDFSAGKVECRVLLMFPY
jgi:hypothetical protein